MDLIQIRRYRQNRWLIRRVSGRWMHRFSIFFVINVAANQTRDKFNTQHDAVLKKIRRVRNLWFKRVKELISSQLWVPGANVTRSSLALTARRCLFCRPSCVFFAKGNLGKLRPCKQNKFCPFCWARLAAYIYWNVRQYTNTRRKQTDGDIVTCIVQREFVRAEGFQANVGFEPDKLAVNVAKLKDIIEKHRKAYERQTKNLQRHTDGSMWSLVVEPRTTGWRVESRQFMVGPAGGKTPTVKLKQAKLVYHRTAKLNTFVTFGNILGRFVRYPRKLLTSYIELAAVALRATYDQRLRSGTGRFRACSTSLAQQFKAAAQQKRILKAAGYGAKENIAQPG